jgi:hypothetical protein
MVRQMQTMEAAGRLVAGASSGLTADLVGVGGGREGARLCSVGGDGDGTADGGGAAVQRGG